MELPYVGGYGSGNAKLVIVGEKPGPVEVEQGIPMVGTSGRMIAEALSNAGMFMDETYRTNVYKYYPPHGNIKLAGTEGFPHVHEGVEEMWQEINEIRPNAILALGNMALYYLTGKSGINTFRGSILRAQRGGYKVIPSIHPAALFKEKEEAGGKGGIPYRMWHVIKLDIKKAVEESQTPDLDLPMQRIEHIRNSAQLYTYLNIYSDRKEFALDTEARRSITTVVSIAANKRHAIAVPLLNVGSWAKKHVMAEHDIPEIWNMLDKFFRRPGMKFIWQNGKYDFEKLLRIGFKIPWENFHADTALMGHTVHPEFPQNLGFLGSIYTRRPYHKQEGKEFDYDRMPLEHLLDYAGKDVLMDFEVYEELDEALEELGLKEFYYGYVHKLTELYTGIEAVGLHLNEDARFRLIEKYIGLHKQFEAELEKIVGFKVNVFSPKDVPRALNETLRLPYMGDWNEDTLVHLITYHCKKTEQERACQLVINDRKVRKNITTYLMSPTDFDNRYRYSVRIGGTETGRTSNSNLEPPLRPMIWIGKKKKPICFPAQTMTKHGEFGPDMREMFEPDAGFVFGECDQSQAEARVVALLSGDFELLELFDKIDVHKMTASWGFETTPEKVTKNMRQVGKAMRHSGNLGVGPKTFAATFNSDARKFNIDMSLSEWKSKQLLERFHNNSPKVRGVFHREVEDMVAHGRTLISPHGRLRQFFDRWGPSLVREALAFIPQSTVSDQTKMAALRIKKRIPGIRIFLESHDALNWMSPRDEFHEHAAIVQEEMQTPIDFSACSLPRGVLTIPCEVKVGFENLRKMIPWDGSRI